MKLFRSRLRELEGDILKEHDNLLKNRIVDFTYLDDIESNNSIHDRINEIVQDGRLEELTSIEIRNSTSGTVFDYYLAEISDKGILLVDNENEVSTFLFSDISSIYDKLIVLEEVKAILPKTNMVKPTVTSIKLANTPSKDLEDEVNRLAELTALDVMHTVDPLENAVVDLITHNLEDIDIDVFLCFTELSFQIKSRRVVSVSLKITADKIKWYTINTEHIINACNERIRSLNN